MTLTMQEWRSMAQFDNIHKLVGVPVITVQLRYDGWVTEMASADQQPQHSQQQASPVATPMSTAAVGLDNLLYRCARAFQISALRAFSDAQHALDHNGLLQQVGAPVHEHLNAVHPLQDLQLTVMLLHCFLFPAGLLTNTVAGAVISTARSCAQRGRGFQLLRGPGAGVTG